MDELINLKNYQIFHVKHLFFQILVCILVGLHYNSMEKYANHSLLISTGAYGGFLIILIGLFAGAVMGTPVNRRIVSYIQFHMKKDN